MIQLTIRSFSLFLAYLCFAVINTSCKKDYSYEGGPTTGMSGGTAVYTLEGAGGNCAGILINGIYITGKTLQPSDNVQVSVNVTTIGTYTLSTGLVNGVQFSTSGNFTVTGLQTITLTGSGTPLAGGIFPYTLPVGLGCTFFVTVTIAPPEMARFTLEGDPGTCSNFIAIGNYISGEALRVTNTVEVVVNVTAIGSYSINTETIEGISFSQSGNFTVTGIQKVRLNGSGTPSTSRILTFTANTGTSVCTFSVMVLPAGPPATYVLESNPDHTCTNYSVSGTCYSGTPLISTNTMSVKAFVTVPGNFTISTNAINGMTFSYTGNFVSLGSQVVVLTGIGTPVNAGTFTFTPQIIGPHPLGGETCTADIDVP